MWELLHFQGSLQKKVPAVLRPWVWSKMEGKPGVEKYWVLSHRTERCLQSSLTSLRRRSSHRNLGQVSVKALVKFPNKGTWPRNTDMCRNEHGWPCGTSPWLQLPSETVDWFCTKSGVRKAAFPFKAHHIKPL